ncbi:MAG: hypothetical protein ABI183_25540 [Polyangiaceae bacterium]
MKQPSSLRGYVFGSGPGSASYAVLSVVAVLVFLAVAPLACSKSSSCDDSKCAAGNKCINTGTTTQCELLCAKQSECPANYFCGPTKAGSTNYCQPSSVTFKSAPGQWGATCNPTGGLDNNPDCDTADQFWCYGRTPTDAKAFCTQFQCSKDTDCGEDYVCATINTYPDVRQAKQQFGQTTTVCLPRTYCEPCNTDIDCVPPTGGTAQCTTGTDNVKFCSYQCQNDGNCPQDAACDSNSGLCKPRAGVCKGDGMLCSPCRSDLDCAPGGGVCATSEYSGERYCTQKSTTPCTVSNTACAKADAYCTATGENSDGTLIYDCVDNKSTTCDPNNNVAHFGCPKTATSNNNPVECSIDDSDPGIPQDQCYGLVDFGTGQNLGQVDGCWSKTTAK